MSAVARESVGALLWRLWRDPAAWVTTVDVFVILLAFSLPWSTSLVAILAAAVLVAMLPFLDVGAFLQSLKRPICVLPMALFALAALGTLWSDAPWSTRLYAIGPTLKLLMLPVLFYHFERSVRGLQVMTAFLVSCALLMVMSWLVAFDPGLSLKPEVVEPGIFVKNYIDQSQEFALCAVALAYPVVTLLRARQVLPALVLVAVALSFVVNMVFVVVSRTVLVTLPVLLAIFALLHLKWRSALIILCVTIGLAGAVWTMSPQLRSTVGSFVTQYQKYQENSFKPTSIGLRLEFWKKSLRFIAEAPIFGHGTGSTRGLFEQAAVGQVGAAAGIVSNPHNQTLNVAVQWGVTGIVVLYAMWIVHLLQFRGDGFVAWTGLLVVLQNMFTSLFNSHLFDFHEGWMYVLGVGVAGGMMLKGIASQQAPQRPDRSVK